MRRSAFVILIGWLAVAPLPANAAGPEPGTGHWPQFRGTNAAGVSDGANLPDAWDAAAGKGVLWKTRIPGLAHSSPVVWGDQVFVTTAVSSLPNATFKPGLYGEGTASEDTTVQKWQLLSLDRKTGKVQWQRTAYEGVPKEKRHIKATYANATPATDGKHVAAFFGSQGLYVYDLAGNLKWKRDLGRLDAGAYDDPSYEWGNASSPILYQDLVIVQCDQQKDSFLIALRLADGEILVVKAGPSFAHVGRNPMGQPLMATPAITGRMLLVRGERELVAIGGR
ncbi:MAG: PQQ-binding-like beta-propeller repeat protein [Burkholderiales bacterium]